MKVFDMRGHEHVLKSTEKRIMSRMEKDVVELYLYELFKDWEYYVGADTDTSLEDIGRYLTYNLNTYKTVDIFGGLEVITEDDKIVKLDRVFCLGGDYENMYGIAFDVNEDYEEVGEGFLVRF